MSREDSNTYVLCKDEVGYAFLIGPFEDEAWARAWIKQHNNNYVVADDPAPGSEEAQEEDRRIADIDHYCTMIETLAGDFDQQHNLIFLINEVEAISPGFDPTTLPRYE